MILGNPGVVFLTKREVFKIQVIEFANVFFKCFLSIIKLLQIQKVILFLMTS